MKKIIIVISLLLQSCVINVHTEDHVNVELKDSPIDILTKKGDPVKLPLKNK